MIVKILRNAASFKGVSYNYNKIEKKKGELIKAVNFSLVQGLSNPKPADYINYLKAYSSKNTRIKLPQFHAALSCKGRSMDKVELTEMAEKWLEGMGYARQPYLLIFHSDTANNHIHMVSTRVDIDGRKIKDSFERIRAYEVLKSIEKVKDQDVAIKDRNKIFDYGFSTIAQARLLLELKGYSTAEKNEHIRFSKYGLLQFEISKEKLLIHAENRIIDKKRQLQIKSIIEKYKETFNRELNPVHEKLPGAVNGKLTGYHSALTDMLGEKFGLKFIFHFSGSRPPYGYTLIDEAKKQVYKGSEIMKLNQLVTGIEISQIESISAASKTAERLKEILASGIFPSLTNSEESEELDWTGTLRMDIDIASDVDDEQVYGQKRKKQKGMDKNRR
ncbi:relaxase/mobilization nuclease domain-containing protein [Pedobacter aquatilis]|uniref:relaxase/mobilization nuclease domain-containing protein n=1 Tax=Pedobacter aquatilis TaxID=351343 RepID=UPI0029318004|nr:relaxase/mobilization nuclease domain-containing protein [Pedobacter aquatilis]